MAAIVSVIMPVCNITKFIKEKLFVDEICRKSQLVFINRYKKVGQSIVVEVNLCHLDMGRVVSFYTYAANTGNQKFIQKLKCISMNEKIL